MISPSFAQLKSERSSLLRAGEVYFENDQYTKAIELLEKVVEKEPTNVYAKFKLAESYRKIQRYEDAKNLYLEVNDAADERFAMSIFHLAVMQKRDGEYQKAITTFNQFFDFLETPESAGLENKNLVYLQALIEQEGCYMATGALGHRNDKFKFENLPKEVNSIYNDYSPQVYNSDTVLVIASGRSGSKGNLIDNLYGEKFPDNFRFVRVSDSTWTEYKGHDKFDNSNTVFGEAPGSSTADGNSFYFTTCDDKGCKIFVCQKSTDKGDWQMPVALSEEVNALGSNSKQPFITPSGDSLFFVSDRDGGQGENDIWMSISSGDGQWSQAVNLGNRVNTPLNEASPFFDSQEGILYFSSNGHHGLGGMDIYKTDGQKWSKVTVSNLGYPFNTDRDDLYFVLGNKIGYLASNREGGKGKFDIYSFKADSHKEIDETVKPKEAEAGRYLMSPANLAYYRIPPEERKPYERVLSTRLVSQVHGTQLPMSEGDYQFYDELPPEEQKMLDQVISSRLRNMTSSDLQAMREEDMFLYDQLTDEQKENVNKIIPILKQANGKRVMDMDPETQAFYENLDDDEKYVVDRVLSSRLRNLNTSELYAIREEDNFYYSNLSSGEKNRIDRIVAIYDVSRYSGQEIDLSNDDQSFLDNLPEEEKEIVNRLITSRLRNLSSSNAIAVREEDQFFYDNLSPEKKEQAQRIVAIYSESGRTGKRVKLSKEDEAFVASLSDTEKESFDQVIQSRLRNTGSSNAYALREEDRFFYENLPNDDKARVNRIVALYDASRKSGVKSTLSREDEAFVASLGESEKQSLDRVIESRIRNMSSSNAYAIREEDRFFYEELTPVEQFHVDRIIVRYIEQASGRTGDKVELSNEERRLISRLTDEERELVAKIVESRLIGGLNNGLTIAFSRDDEFWYNSLSDEHRALVDAIVMKNVEARQLRSTNLQLTGREKYYYESLGKGEHQIIERLIVATIERLNSTNSVVLVSKGIDLAKMAPDDKERWLRVVAVMVESRKTYREPEFEVEGDKEFYESLSGVQRQQMDNMVEARLNLEVMKKVMVQKVEPITSNALLGPNVQNPAVYIIDSTDVKFYGNLPYRDRQIINRLVAINLVNEQYEQDPELMKIDDRTYDSMSMAEKQLITRLGHSMRENDELAAKKVLKPGDLRYYELLSEEKKSVINRLIIKKNFPIDYNGFIATPDEDWAYYNQLFPEEKQRVKRIAEARKANNRIFGTDLERDLRALQTGLPIAAIDARKYEKYNNVTISGRLVSKDSTEIPAGVKVQLVTVGDELVREIVTDENGEFSYSNLSVGKDYKILTSERREKFNQDSKYEIEDLNIEGSHIELATSKFESIYFATNQAGLSEVSLMVLQDLVDVYKEYPGVKIELEAFTDHFGSDEYNLELSRKRAEIARNFLKAYGVSEKDMVVNARGEIYYPNENLTREQSIKNRRIDFTLVGMPESYQPVITTKFVQPGNTLYNIAKEHNMSLDDIKRINAMEDNKLYAYYPIRVFRLPTDTVENVNVAKTKIHRASGDESLSDVAKKYGMKVQDLMRMNELVSEEQVIAGLELKVLVQLQ